MGRFILRRLLLAVFIILVIIFINFIILRLTPGDPYTTGQILAIQANNGKPLTPAQLNGLEQMRQSVAIYLDPWPEAFLRWLGNIVRFDWGNSITSRFPIGPILTQAAFGSLWLLLMSLGLGAGVGIPLGIFAALRRGTWKDKVVQFVSIIFTTLPGWFFLVLFTYLNQQIFILSGKKFSLQPIPPMFGSFNPDFAYQFWGIFLPVFFLAATFLALFCTQARSQTLEVLNEDYVRTARAKGLPARRVLLWHIFRNSLAPLVSILGGLIPFIFGAQILIETSGGWFGLGSLFLQSARGRDYTTLMGIFTILAAACVLCSFLADIGYGLIDPRVREKIK
jgi:peptide/nickel transport system permease protein